MKARVITNLNIRTGSPFLLVNNNPGFYRPGDIIDIKETVVGKNHKNNKVWYKLQDGSFVWSGGVQVTDQLELLRATRGIDFDESKLLWPIKNFGIQDLWQFGAGEGMKIAVLDTGIDLTHPELEGAVIAQHNFIEDSSDVKDVDGHGTHCAGIIAAKGLFDVIGVAPKCKLIIAKIMDFGTDGIDPETLQKALDWTIGKADIVSISGGIPKKNQLVEDAVARVIGNKTPIVAAIGNTLDRNRTSGDYPAVYSTVISAGAIDINGTLASTTIKEPNLTIVAPGVDIKSTFKNGGYAPDSGSSMATPFVAGLIALLKTRHKELTVQEIKAKLISSAVNQSENGYSYHVINPKNLLV